MKELDKLVDVLTTLQGVGEKTASRYAYEILEMNKATRENLLQSIKELDKIRLCQSCNNYTTKQYCDICLDEDRDVSKLVLVAYSKEVEKIEKVLPKKYKYYVLGGVIDPLNDVKAKDLHIEKLLQKLTTLNINEIIFVLPTNTEGEITSAYLKKLLESFNITITKLAQGVPIGGDLDYLDELTLLKSIEHRQGF